MNESNSLLIQQSTEADLFDRLSELMATSEPWMTLGMDTVACRAGFNGPCKEVFVGFCDGKPAGLVIMQICGSFDGYIQILFVPEDIQGRGFGKQLLAFSEERIFRRSPNVFICVSSFNTQARKFYESAGYSVVGMLKGFVKDGFDELLLRKTIGARLGYEASKR